MVCSSCQHFLFDPINPIGGIGQCELLNKWIERNKEAGKIIDQNRLKKAYAQLGGEINTHSALFWPNFDRDCKKFLQKED